MREATEKTILHCYPGLLALITSKYDDQINIMAAGWHTYLSYDPPMYGVAIGKGRHTYQLVKSSGEFAVNFVPIDRANWILKSGQISGRDENKFESFNIKYSDGITVKSPILNDAYIAFECKVKEINTYGDHDFFIGKITQFYEDTSLFMENGLPNLSKIKLPIFLGQSQFIELNETTKIINVD